MPVRIWHWLFGRRSPRPPPKDNGEKPKEVQLAAPPITDMTAKDFVNNYAPSAPAQWLTAWAKEEKAGKNRKTVMAAIDKRKKVLGK